jgi:hypothetical protein
VMSYLNTPWYAKQLRDLTTPCLPNVSPNDEPTRIVCQRPYRPESGPDFYRPLLTRGDTSGVSAEPRRGGAPTASILPLTDEEIEQVANTPPRQTADRQVFRTHGIESTIPEGTVMVPADIFLAQIIHASLGDRPLYFAMTTQAYDELNLRPYLIRQGVALKLNGGPVEPDPGRGIYEVPESQLSPVIGPYIDVTRTEKLLTDVFVHRGGLPEKWGHWVDSATDGIPSYYGYSHMGLAFVYQAHAREADAERHMAIAEKWLRLANQRYMRARGQ